MQWCRHQVQRGRGVGDDSLLVDVRGEEQPVARFEVEGSTDGHR
jgi:hypothetical protein